LAAVFVVAGAAKLVDRQGSRSALVGFGVAVRLARPAAVVLPLAELAVGAALLPQESAWWGAVGALVLLGAFMVVIAANLARGRTPECQCFGQIRSAPVSPSTLARNAVLAAAATLVVAQGADDPGASTVSALSTLGAGGWAAVAGGAAALLGFAVGGWLILALLRHQGLLLLRVEALEARLEHMGGADVPAFGLPVGAPAPPFELAALDGSSASLDRLIARGKPVFLLFFEPHCGPCAVLLPLVSRWQKAYGERLTLAVISRGDRTANSDLAELGLDHVLLQADREVAVAYEVPGTPGAVLIDASGAIASAVALGSESINEFVSRALSAQLRSGNGEVSPPSELIVQQREAAPTFRLPDLTGAFFELSDLRGSETVLLFWDPASESCRQILDDLRTWERANPVGSRKLVVVSVGSAEANRALGLTSLILLDGSAEAARAFGAEGIPAAVLLDGETRMASSVVFGSEAVLQLGGFRDRRAGVAS